MAVSNNDLEQTSARQEVYAQYETIPFCLGPPMSPHQPDYHELAHSPSCCLVARASSSPSSPYILHARQRAH